jgi:glutamate-ammonia-ligase adenylyltransferase
VIDLRALAQGGPDPVDAPARIDRFLAACVEHGGAAACVPDDAAAELLALLAGQSAYLTAPLIRDPRALARLASDPHLRREKELATMRAELAAALAEPRVGLLHALRRFRNTEYLRLGARELGFGAFAQVARELAHLASACLDGALGRVHRELAARHGDPLTSDGRRCRFVVMGMGKLGGEELNFSSDIDLIFVYETDQGSAGRLSLHEFFSRVAERVTRAISDVTDEGFCFRVDLRLRPEGSTGAITNSLAAVERYYEAWGRPWERQAWLKARPVAGDLDLGDEVLRTLGPFIWPRSSGAQVIASVHELMTKIRVELATDDDVKVGQGGIREIEFFVQALQMVHARQPSLHEPNTLRVLDKLLFAGLLYGREHQALAGAYTFLRRVEHRLQLDDGRQTHLLPAHPQGRALLARRLGFADEAAFTRALDDARREVHEIYETLGAPDGAPAPAIAQLFDPLADRAALTQALGQLGFVELETSTDELELLRGKPDSPFAPAAAAPVAPLLLAEVTASPDPDLALRRLVDLVGRRGAAASIWRLVEMHRPLARLLMSLFGTSEFLSRQFIAHPELLEPLLSAAQAEPVRGRGALAAAVARAVDAAPADDEEARLNALRRVKNDEVLRIGLFDVAGELTPTEVSAQLSDLAEVILDAALAIVACATFRKYGTPSARLAVIGLGKLGGGELTYSSDLDVVFIFSDEGVASGGREATNFEVLSRLAQRLVHALNAYLDEGRLYEIDTRLRPSGQKGALVSSLAGFREYHAHEAELWERQALIKARTVAGDRALGAAVEALAAQHVWRGGGDAEHMAAEIGRLRARMERELARESKRRVNIKSGRGGLVDVEFLVQYLQLRDGPRVPSLRVRATAPALAALGDAGVLPPDEVVTLEESYAFLRRLENRLRIVEDRSIQEIEIAPGVLEKLARRMGYHGDRPGARLLTDYRVHADRVREIYARHLPA